MAEFRNHEIVVVIMSDGKYKEIAQVLDPSFKNTWYFIKVIINNGDEL
jgi:hypothetical protein